MARNQGTSINCNSKKRRKKRLKKVEKSTRVVYPVLTEEDIVRIDSEAAMRKRMFER